jgi:hypothetical protein
MRTNAAAKAITTRLKWNLMAHRNEAAYQMAQDWVKWLDSRRFLGPPLQRNILAQFMPSKTGREPNGPMSAELNAFNLAVSSLDIGEFVPFVVIYCEIKIKPIKAIAADMGIGRDTFYDRAHCAASKCIGLVRMQIRLSDDR